MRGAQPGRAGPSRRALLLAGTAVLTAACTDGRRERSSTPTPGSPTSHQPASEEAAIFDLTFETKHRSRPFELIAPGFEAVAQGSGSLDGRHRAPEGPPAPFAAVELVLEGIDPSAQVEAGLATEDDQHVLVRWSAASSRLSLEVRRGGRSRVLRRRKVALSPGSGLAFAVCENQVTALVRTDEKWRPVLTERTKVAAIVDLRREDVLGAHHYSWGGTGARVRSVRAGLFGMTGVRDPHLVQHADGSPYERDGRVFLTWTCAGLGFFQQAHWSVWSLDPAAPDDMRLEAQLFSRRDGLVLGDHAGQLVRDGDRWLVATSSWGDFSPGSIHVRHTTATDDLLTGVHLLETEPTPLPTEHGSWDPALSRVGDAWHVAFVESPSQKPFDFHPALARTSAEDWTKALAPVGAATSLHQCEGPVLANVDGRTWLLASDGDSRCYPVFDLQARRVGRLDAPYPTNIPHPQLLPDPAGGWWLVTFDGTQYAEKVMGYGGHGDLLVMHSA